MTLKIQIILILSTIIFFAFLVKTIKKSKMTTDLATIWIIFGLLLIIIAIFPQIIYFVGNLIGILSPMNTLFMISIFGLLCLVFYLFTKITLLETRLTSLIQNEGIYRKRNEDNENN